MRYSGVLVTTSCWCGIHLAVPEQLESFARRKGHEIYCPVGHTFVYTDTETKRLKADLERANQATERANTRADYWRKEQQRTELKRRAMKGQLTKARRRIGNGVCPVCKRSFPALAAHMQTKHADYQPEDT